ncbi:MAG: nucleoside-diphosphate sugar epimerase/dehydratase [Syntrophales bacterium]|nr:nucleoside-diphosphate sugar epimerase/dehydratase [Syntrophales bacterium]
MTPAFRKILIKRNMYLMILADGFLVAAALFFSFILRFDGGIPAPFVGSLTGVLPVSIVVKLVVFYFFGLYRGMWRYTSLRDLQNVTAAVVISSVALTAYLMFIRGFSGFPRSVVVIDFVLTFLFVGGVRVVVRILLNREGGFLSPGKEDGVSEGGFREILIVGAGNAGEKAVRDMLDNRSMKMRPVGFLDDDSSKWGKSIHGVSVLGGLDSIMSHRELFDEIVIAVPSATGQQTRRIVSFCDKTGKRYLIMPGLSEIMDGRVSVKSVRKVRYEDLLGREVVSLDEELLRETYRGKRVLVTGAGGSIGRELVRQIAGQHPGVLGLLDFSEYNLYQVETTTRQMFEFIPVSSYLVNIRDEKSLRRALEEFNPEVVFHAAALKHVPMQELNPWEAVMTNVQGTLNLILALRDMAAPERFVLVSTDKAVRPTSVMGATKRVAELIMECSKGNPDSRFVAVRFGNVLGSSGSVIPLFMEQIKNRLPLTVTHPDVTRYFMSVSEASQLILQAGAMGEGGEIFILDMGRPVKIADMARDLIRLNGYEPDKDIPIRFVGLRPGEKLYEELITEGEGIMGTRHEKIRVIRGRNHDFNSVNGQVEELVRAAKNYDAALIKEKLKEIIPEYTPSED